MVKILKKQQTWTKNVKEKIFSREVFSKTNQSNKQWLKRYNSCVFLLKYGQNCANGQV